VRLQAAAAMRLTLFPSPFPGAGSASHAGGHRLPNQSFELTGDQNTVAQRANFGVHGEGKRLLPDDLSVPNEVSACA
jgi:hypothetical protein